LHVEVFATMRNAQLVAAGPHQNFEGWSRLESAISAELRETRSVRNPYGFSLVIAAVVMVGMVTASMVGDPDTVQHSLHEMLRLPATVSE
jgi:hypothetical protein